MTVQPNPLHDLPEFRTTAIATATGGWFDVLNPQPEQVRLTDVQNGLARLRRWTGQTLFHPPTVLEHSLHVHEIACKLTDDRQVRACALLHDAHEAYVGDVSRPVKAAMAQLFRSYAEHPALAAPGLANLPDPWQAVEMMAQTAVLKRFGLLEAWHADAMGARVVEQADRLALGYEADLLYGWGTAAAWGLPAGDPPSKRTSPQATLMRFRSTVVGYTGVND